MIKKITAILILICFISTYIFSQASFINEKLDEQEDLLQSLEIEMNNVRLYVSQLKENNEELTLTNQQLEKTIEMGEAKIESLMNNIDSMRKALLSNKEDTSTAIELLGNMYQELEQYKGELNVMRKKNKNANLFVEIMIPTVTVPLIGFGAYEYYVKNDNMGKVMMWTGSVSLIGAELVWNGGKFVLKIW